MKSIIKIIPDSNAAVNLSASILIHVIIFIITAFAFKITIEKSAAGGSYVQIKTRELIANPETKIVETERIESPEKENLLDENKIKRRNVSESKIPAYIIASSDTTGLYQIYKESTLDVSIRYPVGWRYIDQDVKNKLDGVTFWAVNGIYSPPPYVHLEVKEKYLFNPSRYKYSFKTNDYTAYYNDPKELSGQVSQEVYIRTSIDEDFSIKLIMKGMESFRTFQPVFFGMIKTFKFDNSLF